MRVTANLVAGIFAVVGLVHGAGCVDDEGPIDISSEALSNRAYVISAKSDELFVVDLRSMTEVARVDTGLGIGDQPVNANHMAVLSRDASKLYVTATHYSSIVVVDTATLEITKTIGLGAHPTHANPRWARSASETDQLWVVDEQDNSISVVDMTSDEVTDTITDKSLMAPHFVQFSNGFAYVPNIGGNQITVVDVATHRVVDVLLTHGAAAPGNCWADPCGFADAQIDGNGMLVAAHIESGNVIMYDTVARTRVKDLHVGNVPWSVFVDALSNDYDTYLMPNWGDQTVSVIDRVARKEIARSSAGDKKSYGVNYSPLAPGKAFVLNRTQRQISVVDRITGELATTIDVGGTTETASTTGDGKYLLVPVSSADAFAVVDVVTGEQVARFSNVGNYPWSVAVAGGQNYCH